MTSAELQECIRIVLESLKDSTKSIADLPSMAKAAETDCIEVSGGRKISIADLRKTLSGMSKAQLEALLASLNQLETSVGVSEDERKAAESLRDNAEQARVAAETARGKAETARASAGTARQKAESTRTSNETARDTAGIARTKAETARQSAEQTRQTKESSRQTAEQSRVSAETKRVAAENAREEAESARAAEFASLSTASQAATKAANNAAAAANGAATAATDAATAASNAASDVNDAKTNANNAATAANAAATNANNAANSLATTIAGKQDKLSTSEDLSISAGNMLALTDMAKKRLFIDVWNDACRWGNETYGCYNEDTGFFELNGLTDITYAQAVTIYNDSISARSTRFLSAAFNVSKMRTNLPFVRYTMSEQGYYAESLFRFASVEVVNLYPNGGRVCFRILDPAAWIFSSNKLHTILGPIELTGAAWFYNGVDAALKEIRLKNLTKNVTFQSCPLLSYDSLRYLVDNAANTSAITVTVHPEVFAKLTDEGNEEWNKVLTDAAEKQITFTTV